ncbi:MAG: DUF2341 domain-containing protein, partial [Thermoplasmata archaeon]
MDNYNIKKRRQFAFLLSILVIISIFQFKLLYLLYPTASGEDVSERRFSDPIALNLTETAPLKENISVPSDVYIASAVMNISTPVNSAHAPLSPSVDIGNDSTAEWTYSGTGYGRFGIQEYFSDGNRSFTGVAGNNASTSFIIPEGANIESAFVNATPVPVKANISHMYDVDEDYSGGALDGLNLSDGKLFLEKEKRTLVFGSQEELLSGMMNNISVNSGRISLAKRVNWFSEEWKFRVPILITNTASAPLQNYSLLVIINTAYFIYQNMMKEDCSDMRFTSVDGTDLYSYWIEGGINTASTAIWVFLPYAPASSVTTIYMYTGNERASSYSNIANAFLFYDSFETGYQNNWHATSPNIWGISESRNHSGSRSLVAASATSSNNRYILAKNLNLTNISFDSWWYLDTYVSYFDISQCLRCSFNPNFNDYEINWDGGNWVLSYTLNGGWHEYISTSYPWPTNGVWMKVTLQIYGNNFRFLLNDAQVLPSSGWYETSAGLQNGTIGFRAWTTPANRWYIDDVRVRNFVYPEPLVTPVYQVEGIYLPQGEYLTPPLRPGGLSIDNVSWNSSLPAGTSIVIYERTGNTPTPEQGGWSVWNILSNNSVPQNNSTEYIQFKAVLQTSYPCNTPEIDDFAIEYTGYRYYGTYTSFQLDPPAGSCFTGVWVSAEGLLETGQYKIEVSSDGELFREINNGSFSEFIFPFFHLFWRLTLYSQGSYTPELDRLSFKFEYAYYPANISIFCDGREVPWSGGLLLGDVIIDLMQYLNGSSRYSGGGNGDNYSTTSVYMPAGAPVPVLFHHLNIYSENAPIMLNSLKISYSASFYVNITEVVRALASNFTGNRNNITEKGSCLDIPVVFSCLAPGQILFQTIFILDNPPLFLDIRPVLIETLEDIPYSLYLPDYFSDDVDGSALNYTLQPVGQNASALSFELNATANTLSLLTAHDFYGEITFYLNASDSH